MIYWPSTPGAEYIIAIPNQYGLTAEDIASVKFVVLNNVGRQVYPSGDFQVDEVTPDWLLLHLSNEDPMEEGSLPPDGEYTYEALLVTPNPDTDPIPASRTLSVGIMQFGEYKAERTQYDNPIEYEQYDN